MDPTQTLIDLLTALQRFETEFAKDPKSEASEQQRTEAIGQLDALRQWLGPLDGAPPNVSEIEL